MEALELVNEICRIIDEKQGSDIVVQNLQGLSDVAEYFIIATGANNRQVDGMADEIENVLRPLGERAFAIEGREECTWLLMDFGTVLVHLFQPETRNFYRLERLWGDAPRATFADGELSAFEGESPKVRVGIGIDASGTKLHAEDIRPSKVAGVPLTQE